MKVAINAILVNDQSSGVGNYIRGLADGLDRTFTPGIAKIDVFKRSDVECGSGWRRLQYRTVHLAASARIVRIGWEQCILPRELARSYDVLHAPAYVAPIASPIPTVLTVHDTIALEQPDLCSHANRWHYQLLMPASLRRAAAIIVPTEWVRARVIHNLPDTAKKIVVIHEGVGDLFRSAPEDCQTADIKRELRLSGRTVLFVGNIEPKKNLGNLLAAFGRLREQFPDVQLVLAGRTGWKVQSLLRNLRARRGAGGVVTTGYISTERLRALYRAADVFAFPSTVEGFGVPPLEAMASGTPVVTSTAGAVAEVVGDAALKVDPFDVDGWARALGSVLENSNLRCELRERGLARSRKFSWDVAARQTFEVYTEAARAG
jgi:glycosyltransferase involved in cell wall biosynthesis